MTNTKLSLIQVFRGLAAVLVVAHHVTKASEEYFQTEFWNGFFLPGWSGVDFFFVLSGFIIFFVHHKDISNPSKIGRFALKRIIRIYPIYWLVSLMVLPYFLLIPRQAGDLPLSTWSIFQSFLLIPQTGGPFLGVAWSLCYEVFFYFLFGIMIIFSRKYYTPIILAWLTLVIGSTSGLFHPNGFWQGFLSSFYHVEFILGCISAYIVLNYSMYFYKFVLAGGIIIFIATWGIANALELHQAGISTLNTQSTAVHLLFGLGSSMIVIGSAKLDTYISSNLPKYLLCLGDASYSIYLLHPMILALLYKILHVAKTPSALYMIASLTIFAVSILAGCLFHYKIERPIVAYVTQVMRIDGGWRKVNVAGQ